MAKAILKEIWEEHRAFVNSCLCSKYGELLLIAAFCIGVLYGLRFGGVL
jgi:hypothetical protein